MKQLETAATEWTRRCEELAKKRNITFTSAMELMEHLDPELFKRYMAEGSSGVAHPRLPGNAATETFDDLVKRYMAEHQVSFSEAANAVMKEPGIYQAYRRQVTV